MRRAALLSGLFLLAASGARADYAVLRSGERLHFTSREMVGDVMRLTIAGGSVDLPVGEIVSIEAEDVFQPNAVAATASGPFGDIIRAAALKHGVDEYLIACVIAEESNFNPRAVSPKAAAGLMQLLPGTAARFSVRDVFDPAENVEAGTRYLKELLDHYRGDVRLALAAYNAGPEVVSRYGGVPPFSETRNYVKHVTARYALVTEKSKLAIPRFN